MHESGGGPSNGAEPPAQPAADRDGPSWDETTLNDLQRTGAACVFCDKRWPRPTVPAGSLPDGTRLYACPDHLAAPGVRDSWLEWALYAAILLAILALAAWLLFG